METKNDSQRYTIDELSALTGLSRRTIRYYVQEGLIDPPAGRGRGGYYYDSHLRKLRQITSLQGKKMRLSAMATVLNQSFAEPESPKRDSWVRYEITPGMELHVSTNEETLLAEKIPEIVRIVRMIVKGEKR